MTQPSNVDREYKREIIFRATADAAWSFVGNLPLELDFMIQQGIVTKEEIFTWFQEELEKLI